MDFPCHAKPQDEWCDRYGPGGFMGHTCIKKEQPEKWRGIGKLAEECGEVLQLLGKAIAFPTGDHPDGKGSIRERLPFELADLKAAIAYFEYVNNLRVDTIREKEKFDKFIKWGLTGVHDLRKS